MTLNLDIIGKKLEPVKFSYDQDSVILYALGRDWADQVFV
jgi:hypothetical protein